MREYDCPKSAKTDTERAFAGTISAIDLKLNSTAASKKQDSLWGSHHSLVCNSGFFLFPLIMDCSKLIIARAGARCTRLPYILLAVTGRPDVAKTLGNVLGMSFLGLGSP